MLARALVLVRLFVESFVRGARALPTVTCSTNTTVVHIRKSTHSRMRCTSMLHDVCCMCLIFWIALCARFCDPRTGTNVI